jgi:hypothetical protein
MPIQVARVGIATTIAAMCLAAVSAQRPADVPTSVALYAGVGEELITFGVDVERATLSRSMTYGPRSSIARPRLLLHFWPQSPGARRPIGG